MFMKRWVDISDEVYSLYAKNFYWIIEKKNFFAWIHPLIFSILKIGTLSTRPRRPEWLAWIGAMQINQSISMQIILTEFFFSLTYISLFFQKY